jgi:hypothetical protein
MTSSRPTQVGERTISGSVSPFPRSSDEVAFPRDGVSVTLEPLDDHP